MSKKEVMTPQEEIIELKKAISLTLCYISPSNVFYDMALNSVRKYEARIVELSKKIEESNED